ncbi:MAG: hydroxymethylglutaryl-CoA synthase [Holosporaceae bacterium]|jgi:hydroxymethylglutaryl-CoA synthase|nr:hydroxymethylglutaryl-CoA synthase [Holosporaceae bacterium]
MNIGIDSIAFSTSNYFLDLRQLASHRDVDYDKYCIGIGQTKMSIFPPNEDVVTIAVEAARKALRKVSQANRIDMLIFATESAFDLSKSAGIYVHRFLKLREDCRVFDLKQACYSATAALRLAKSHVAENPDSMVLIVASDVVKYSPHTLGEPTQGGGSVAMVVSRDPRILTLEDHSGVHTADVMDFWRPVDRKEALFDSKLSVYNYLKSLEISFGRYLEKVNFSAYDVDYACYHAPFCKMARKAHRQIFKNKSVENTLIYNAVIGNSCSASLYICFVSLLDNSPEDLGGKRIGFYSYGSGSVAEFFSGLMVRGYEDMLTAEENRRLLENRTEISFAEYENFGKADAGGKKYKNIGDVTLADVENGRRMYAENSP